MNVIKFILLLVFVIQLVGCDSGADEVIQPDFETDSKNKYFAKYDQGADLMLEREQLISSYPSATVYLSLPSTNSLIVSMSDDDAIKYEEASPDNLTPYFQYRETSDFEELAMWSRFYYSDEDFHEFKQFIDSIFYSSVGDELNFTFLNDNYTGQVSSIKQTELGHTYISIRTKNSNLIASTIHYTSSVITAKIFFENSRKKYRFEYTEVLKLGFLFPAYEYDYLVGGLGLE